jgi:hypothetical protein
LRLPDNDTTTPLAVYDLRRRRRVTVTVLLGDEQGIVRRAVLKRNGAFAWIQANEGTNEVLVCTYRPCASRGFAMPERVDSGRGIEPQSLRLHGSRVSWLNDGERRSAPL